MNSDLGDPRDQPADPQPKTDPSEPADAPVAGAPGPVMGGKTERLDLAAVDQGASLPGNATGPAPGETLASAIDGASRPDRVAIGLMVGVLVLLLICVAFGFAAR